MFHDLFLMLLILVLSVLGLVVVSSALFKTKQARYLRKRPNTVINIIQPIESNPPLPFGRRRCKPAFVLQWLIQAKAYSPHKGCRALALEFNRAYAAGQGNRPGVTISKSYVYTTLLKHQYAVTERRRTLKTQQPRTYKRNAVWGMDLTGKRIYSL